MNKWQIVGVLMILLGLAVIVLLAGFIVTIIVTLLKLIAVFIGIILIVAGVALLVGRRWMKAPSWTWGPQPSSTQGKPTGPFWARYCSGHESQTVFGNFFVQFLKASYRPYVEPDALGVEGRDLPAALQ